MVHPTTLPGSSRLAEFSFDGDDNLKYPPSIDPCFIKPLLAANFSFAFQAPAPSQYQIRAADLLRPPAVVVATASASASASASATATATATAPVPPPQSENAKPPPSLPILRPLPGQEKYFLVRATGLDCEDPRASDHLAPPRSGSPIPPSRCLPVDASFANVFGLGAALAALPFFLFHYWALHPILATAGVLYDCGISLSTRSGVEVGAGAGAAGCEPGWGSTWAGGWGDGVRGGGGNPWVIGGDFSAVFFAGKVAAAACAAGSGAVLFLVFSRFLRRRRERESGEVVGSSGRRPSSPHAALVVSALYAFGSGTWSTSSQGLWQHGPSVTCLSGALLSLQSSYSWSSTRAHGGNNKSIADKSNRGRITNNNDDGGGGGGDDGDDSSSISSSISNNNNNDDDEYEEDGRDNNDNDNNDNDNNDNDNNDNDKDIGKSPPPAPRKLPPVVGLLPCGFFLGLATLCRPTNGLVVIVFGVHIFLVLSWRHAASYAAGGLPVAMVLALYNQALFGSAFSNGQMLKSVDFLTLKGRPSLFSTPLGEGLAGLLVSPSRGLFVFSPWTVLALPGLLQGLGGFIFSIWSLVSKRGVMDDRSILPPAALSAVAVVVVQSLW